MLYNYVTNISYNRRRVQLGVKLYFWIDCCVSINNLSFVALYSRRQYSLPAVKLSQNSFTAGISPNIISQNTSHSNCKMVYSMEHSYEVVIFNFVHFIMFIGSKSHWYTWGYIGMPLGQKVNAASNCHRYMSVANENQALCFVWYKDRDMIMLIQ